MARLKIRLKIKVKNLGSSLPNKAKMLSRLTSFKALPRLGARGFSAAAAAAAAAAATLPPLPYDVSALEPHISAEIMTIHHTKHHQTYVTNLNASLASIQSAVEARDSAAIIALSSAIKFNGGGHINHSLFWENLTPPGEYKDPSGDLLAEIDRTFGSFEAMKAEMAAKTVAVQGSGWGWLGWCGSTKSLKIATTPNQDPLHATTGLKPLLGIDVWEHAYYLDYKNVRPDYVKNIWGVVNWGTVACRLAGAKA